MRDTVVDDLCISSESDGKLLADCDITTLQIVSAISEAFGFSILTVCKSDGLNKREGQGFWFRFSWKDVSIVVRLLPKTPRLDIQSIMQTIIKLHSALQLRYSNGLILHSVEPSECLAEIASFRESLELELLLADSHLQVALERQDLLALSEILEVSQSNIKIGAKIIFDISLILYKDQLECELVASKMIELAQYSLLLSSHGKNPRSSFDYFICKSTSINCFKLNQAHTNQDWEEMKMNLDLYIRLGEVGLTLDQLLALRQGALVNVDWSDNREVELCFDDQAIARGVLKTDDGRLKFRVMKVLGENSEEIQGDLNLSKGFE